MPVATLTGEMDARELPSNVEAEAALLGAMMIDNRIADDLADRLAPAHFHEPVHGRIFAAIGGLRAADMKADPITLRPLMEADEGLKQLNGVRYLAQLTGSGAALIGARDFARQIRDLAAHRALITVGRTLVERALDTSQELNPRAQIEAAEQMLAEVDLHGTASRPAIGFAQAWDSAFCEVEAIGAGKRERGIVIGGVPEWNEICGGGMMTGQLILLGGRPGMGKTAVALAVARRTAEAGHGVLFISREMPVEQLMMRIIADMLFEAGGTATFDDVLHGRLSPADHQHAVEIRKRIDAWPLVFEEPASLNASRVGGLIRQHQRRFAQRGQTLKLVVVDYLGLLDPPVKRSNREQEMGDTSRELKNVARSTGTAMLALAQLNRGVEQREDKRPLLSDLRDSGSLEQDADTVVFAYRAEYYLRQVEPDQHDRKREGWETEMAAERNRLDIYSAKVRQGATQRRKVHFFGSRQAVRDADYYRSGGAGWGPQS